MDLLKILVGFLLTGLIGNWLVQRWQTRNWFLQQRYLGQEKEYVALKELSDEIATLLAVRVFHMQRIARTLVSGEDSQFKDRLKDYDEAVKRWNERLHSFYVRLPLLVENDAALQLERNIQKELVNTSEAIDRLVQLRKSGKKVEKTVSSQIERELNIIQGRSIAFNKRLMRLIRLRRTDIYFGTPINFSAQNLERFSTRQLIKALFIRNINSFSIVRTPADS